jgi:hypothetical protein
MKPSRQSSYRREKYAEDTANIFSMVFNVQQVESFVDMLAEDLAQAVRPAAQAGAQVLYDQVKINVSSINRKTGSLAESIYQVYSNRISKPGESAYYHISWNGSKAPHGHLVEYGHIKTHLSIIDRRTGKWITLKNKKLANPVQVPPRSFVRKAQAHLPAALEVATAEFYKRLKAFK